MSEHLIKQRSNPRYKNRLFAIQLKLEGLNIKGIACNPSKYGANVQVNKPEYELLLRNKSLGEKESPVLLVTQLNELEGCINGLYEQKDGKYVVSVKLLNNKTWYS